MKERKMCLIDVEDFGVDIYQEWDQVHPDCWDSSIHDTITIMGRLPLDSFAVSNHLPQPCKSQVKKCLYERETCLNARQKVKRYREEMKSDDCSLEYEDLVSTTVRTISDTLATAVTTVLSPISTTQHLLKLASTTISSSTPTTPSTTSSTLPRSTPSSPSTSSPTTITSSPSSSSLTTSPPTTSSTASTTTSISKQVTQTVLSTLTTTEKFIHEAAKGILHFANTIIPNLIKVSPPSSTSSAPVQISRSSPSTTKATVTPAGLHLLQGRDGEDKDKIDDSVSSIHEMIKRSTTNENKNEREKERDFGSSQLYDDEVWHFPTDVNKARFRSKGRMVGSLAFGHIVLDFNIKQLHEKLREFCDELKNFTIGSDTDSNKFINDVLTGYRIKCRKLETKMTDLYDLWFSTIDPPSVFSKRSVTSEVLDSQIHIRPKRQLVVLGAIALVAGAAALFSYYFSHSALVDVSVGASTSKTAIQVMQDHETRISISEQSIKTLNATIKELAVRQATDRHKIARLASLHKIQFQYEELKDTVERVLKGLECLHNGRISSDLIMPTKLSQVIIGMKTRLAAVNLKMVLEGVEQFYRMETSYLAFRNHSIRAIVHIPLFKENSLLDLFEFSPLPVEIGPNHFLEISTNEKVLAVNDRNTHFRVLSAYDLSLCHKIDRLFYCKNSNHYFRSTADSCLFSLYTRNLAKAMDVCQFSVELKSNRMIQLSNNQVVIYHHKEQPVKHLCDHSAAHEDSISFTGFRTFLLNPSCQIVSPDFIAEGSSSIFYYADTIENTDLDLLDSDLVVELQDHLSDLLDHLSTVGSSKNIKVKDLNALFAKETKAHHIKIGLITGISFLLFLAVALYVYFKCCHQSCLLWCKRRNREIIRKREREEYEMKELHKKHPSVSFRRLRRSPDSTDTKEEREREVALIENLEKTEIPSAPMLTPTKNNRDSYANPAGTYNELYDTNVVKNKV